MCILFTIIKICKTITISNTGVKPTGKSDCDTKPRCPKLFVGHGQVFAKNFRLKNKFYDFNKARDYLIKIRGMKRLIGNAYGINPNKQQIIKNGYNCFEEQPINKVPKVAKGDDLFLCLVHGDKRCSYKKLNLLYNNYLSLERDDGKIHIYPNDEKTHSGQNQQ